MTLVVICPTPDGLFMSSYEIIGSGDAADIFALGEDKVVKVYRRQLCRPSVEYSLDDYDAYIYALCRAEIYSYKKIQPYEKLRIHTPVFYGTVDPFEVFPLLKFSKRGYVKGCGIVLECIKGNDVKIGNLGVTEQG